MINGTPEVNQFPVEQHMGQKQLERVKFSSFFVFDIFKIYFVFKFTEIIIFSFKLYEWKALIRFFKRFISIQKCF